MSKIRTTLRSIANDHRRLLVSKEVVKHPEKAGKLKNVPPKSFNQKGRDG